jgi:hypothetical protein
MGKDFASVMLATQRPGAFRRACPECVMERRPTGTLGRHTAVDVTEAVRQQRHAICSNQVRPDLDLHRLSGNFGGLVGHFPEKKF